MNLLYLLGNGFDRNLGLPTLYSDFYNYYSEVKNDDEDIIKLKENIEQYKDKDWADLELGLGEYLKYVDTYEKVRKIYIDINKELQNYLIQVNSIEYTYSAEDLKLFFRDLAFPYVKLTPKEQKLFISYIDNGGVNISNLNSSIISFNYTKTFEKIYEHVRKVDTVKFANHNMYYYLHSIVHIHQTVENNGIILGVDNPNQIKNEKLANDERVRTLLVKRECYDNLGTLNDEKSVNLIKGAHIICIFGLSLGETDQLWWNVLKEHLLSSICRVIYFAYTRDSFIIDLDKANYKREMKEFFIQKLGFEETQITEDLKSRIFVVVNSDMFKMNNILDKVPIHLV